MSLMKSLLYCCGRSITPNRALRIIIIILLLYILGNLVLVIHMPAQDHSDIVYNNDSQLGDYGNAEEEQQGGSLGNEQKNDSKGRLLMTVTEEKEKKGGGGGGDGSVSNVTIPLTEVFSSFEYYENQVREALAEIAIVDASVLDGLKQKRIRRGKGMAVKRDAEEGGFVDLDPPEAIGRVTKRQRARLMEKFHHAEKDVEKFNAVRDEIAFIWDKYVEVAFGSDYINPMGKGSGKNDKWAMGLTIFDGLDTLYIAGLESACSRAIDYIRKVDFREKITQRVSVFETVIRIFGGVLSGYALTKEPVLREKAIDIGNVLAEAFSSDGFLHTLIEPDEGPVEAPAGNKTTKKRRFKGIYYQGASVSIAEVGTVQLEFGYLSEITGNSTYAELADGIMERLNDLGTPEGVFPKFVPTRFPAGEQPDGDTKRKVANYMVELDALEEAKRSQGETGEKEKGSSGGTGGGSGKMRDMSFLRGDYGVGPNIDSFYEYLLKRWVQTGGTNEMYKDMYHRASTTIASLYPVWVHVKNIERPFMYLDMMSGSVVKDKGLVLSHKYYGWEHLSCFTGGMYALGYMHRALYEVERDHVLRVVSEAMVRDAGAKLIQDTDVMKMHDPEDSDMYDRVDEIVKLVMQTRSRSHSYSGDPGVASVRKLRLLNGLKSQKKKQKVNKLLNRNLSEEMQKRDKNIIPMKQSTPAEKYAQLKEAEKVSAPDLLNQEGAIVKKHRSAEETAKVNKLANIVHQRLRQSVEQDDNHVPSTGSITNLVDPDAVLNGATSAFMPSSDHLGTPSEGRAKMKEAGVRMTGGNGPTKPGEHVSRVVASTPDFNDYREHLRVGRELGRMCHLMYESSTTGLGAEMIKFSRNGRCNNDEPSPICSIVDGKESPRQGVYPNTRGAVDVEAGFDPQPLLKQMSEEENNFFRERDTIPEAGDADFEGNLPERKRGKEELSQEELNKFHRTDTKNPSGDTVVPYPSLTHSVLRPEAVESWFVLYRITGDQKYRAWGWDLFKSLQRHSRVEKGFSGLKDVNNVHSKDNFFDSFVLAETFKYLLLLFSDADTVPLDKWVFNTEAHPLPIDPSRTMARKIRYYSNLMKRFGKQAMRQA